MKKFEYMQLRTNNIISINELLEHGNNGWELVCITTEESYPDYSFVYYFKKEIPA